MFLFNYFAFLFIWLFPFKGGEEVLREGVWGNRRGRFGSGCVFLLEMIASEEKKVERRDQNCGSLNVWSAADKDL